MDSLEALCASLELAREDGGAEAEAFAAAVESEMSGSFEIGEDGSITLTSGDATFVIPAEALGAEGDGEGEESAEGEMPEELV